MNKSFVNCKKPLNTVMLLIENPEDALGTIRNANCQGADAYGWQVEFLKREYQNPDTYKKLFSEMNGRPCYVTNYRFAQNTGKTDEELAAGLITLAESGATLCDVMGDAFCRHPEELTDNADAIKKQMELIDELHSKGAEVIMSSHIRKFTSAEHVLAMAREQKRRGADIIKLVTGADDMQQQIENLRITDLLKRELGAPFLFLSVGKCSLHRRLGTTLGCCMSLCVYQHDRLSASVQPLLSTMKTISNDIDF